ncbi:hypothetical protein [Edaphobacter albus]|uniref:hypothetical protein n=1 Tax=Edaphobacter sp. 4G125 TaxID=2763071 RepID=UPI00164441AB|nr:hypothetical protein [Edaphobacter sp. 4G125]QNI37443.1 hypothetical protein H7846_03795 [Edaphobacter sp. 4G125]
MMQLLLAVGVPEACMVGTFHSHGWIALAITVVGLMGAIYSLAMGFRWLREESDSKRQKRELPDRRTAKGWLLGLWVLLPPAWLYVESIFLYRHYGKAECFDQFRYAQELVSKGWIVLVAVLGFLYFGREILRKE